MKLFRFFSLLGIFGAFSVSTASLFGEVRGEALELPEDCSLVADSVEFSEKTVSDSYLEAYIQGVLDTKYPDTGIRVSVRNGDVFLKHLPADNARAEEIVLFVTSLTHRSVKEAWRPKKEATDASHSEESPEWHGVWLPQSTVLYPTQIANPRQICFSGGMRLRDRVAGKVATAVTFGDQFPVYRWAGFKGGDLQLELEGGAFAIFDMHKREFPLVNSDWYGGLPLTFARGPWSYRLRFYHISSHVGDEFLESHNGFCRKNKSFEAFDLSADYQVAKNLRFYAVLGSVVHSDSEMSMKRSYFEYGFEARGPRSDFKQLFGQPFLAVHMQNWQENHFALDSTYALGYEWGKIHGVGRKVRAFIEYHQGFSPDGQFSRIRTKYFGLRFSYGF
jgi:hypothetical protein